MTQNEPAVNQTHTLLLFILSHKTYFKKNLLNSIHLTYVYDFHIFFY